MYVAQKSCVTTWSSGLGMKTTRRSQSVVPFGVGAIVEFEDEALMAAGLDVWPTQGPRLYDERLARRLGVAEFRAPPPMPEKRQKIPEADWLPYVRFPQSHFCPRCRYVKIADLYARNRPSCDNLHQSPRLYGGNPCGTRLENRPRMVPLRFLVACKAGHIEGLPLGRMGCTQKKGKPSSAAKAAKNPSFTFSRQSGADCPACLSNAPRVKHDDP